MKTALITGAVKNCGLAIARRFAAEGYDVCITSRRKDEAVKTAASLSAEFGVRAAGYGLDQSDAAMVDETFDRIEKEFGRLDAFVANSADLGLGQKALEVTAEEFDRVMRVNVTGTFLCCRRAALLMKENGGGSIVLIGSVHSHGAVRGRVAYAASKGALDSLKNNLAYELAQYGIRVNQVVPGAIRTDRWEGISPEEEARRRANWPLGIESSGEEIANAVWFLASDQSKTTTGADLTVDSGLLTCLLPYKKD